jgi:V8-like Glu-specific endopeptidase
MWIPSLLEQNISDMQEMGFKLNTEDIYSINHTSMKDAIVHFGGGCTGELISPEGLLVTNYHCGYGEIQSHSSVENDYLTNGFWAANRNEELANPGLSVTFLISIEEVTLQVLAGTDSTVTTSQIDSITEANRLKIINGAKEKTGYDAVIKPFYEGNQYYLLLTETFSDVRLVGAPPSSIGKFGGDTDNWMWPRHTGDFSLFRIYAGKDNKPAAYSTENIPYCPKSFFPINISGVKEGDFTMVFGYPGSTQQYLPSHEVKMIVEETDPDRIAIRDIKLKILSDYMQKDDETRIKYSAKYASTSNAWKKWQGEIIGLKRLETVENKSAEESAFIQWVNADSLRKQKYAHIFPSFDTLYPAFRPLSKATIYYTECLSRGSDIFRNYLFVSSLKVENDQVNAENQKKEIEKRFKDYSVDVDCEVFTKLIIKYHNDLPADYLPKELTDLFNHDDYRDRLNKLYRNSLLTSKEAMVAITGSNLSAKVISKYKNDKLYRLIDAITNHYNNTVSENYLKYNRQIDMVQKRYVKALLEMKSGEMIFPDANSTLRVSYGKVEGYKARDGVNYNYYTTLDGIIEKSNSNIDDYTIDNRLKELYHTKDFGRYALPDATMPVCFTASNHTTGGNSGSPVIDAMGNLIGINFDRCWEGTMSDIDFDPEKCRNISLDMRYMLFIIDKYAKAVYLLSEMKIIE